MLGDIFVFDNVIHVYDMSPENIRTDRPDALQARNQVLSHVRAVRWPGVPLHDDPSFDWGRRWQTQEMYDLVFGSSATDMAMAQVVPMFDWFKDWYAPIRAQYEMARAYPERVLFCGGVDPKYRGLNDALEQIDYQAKELGACSFKFYNGHAKVSDCWRCDDERIAYPMYERARAAGIRVLQFHKGNPYGLQNVEWLSPVDLQAPARDFPEIDFIVHHLALPYFEELVSIASRFPNVYLSLAGYITFYSIAPRRVQEHLGRLLQAVGVEKILWGSESALAGGPAPYLQAFMDLQIPEDLRSGYGYPQITPADKRKILGGNFARIMNIDIEAKCRQLASVADEAGA
ncbi:MAG TPA: amidohydrolase family protein [Steroidobacteraceae bacterium]|nr:amidohydrolase family protein [Steroidobacteraceae bacterium]